MVPGTFCQLYVQIVFAVRGRENLIASSWRKRLHEYIAAIIRAKNQKSIIVNGTADHIHIFVGFKPTCSIADLVRDIKNNSTKFINDEKFLKGKFSWQEGYGAFTYAHSQVESVFNYILNQEEHHRKSSFKEEYLAMLSKFQIVYDKRFLCDWIENGNGSD